MGHGLNRERLKQEAHRISGHRDIGESGGKGFEHGKIAIRDFPIRLRCVGPHRLSGGQVAEL
jgi:hypothetical protein